MARTVFNVDYCTRCVSQCAVCGLDFFIRRRVTCAGTSTRSCFRSPSFSASQAGGPMLAQGYTDCRSPDGLSGVTGEPHGALGWSADGKANRVDLKPRWARMRCPADICGCGAGPWVLMKYDFERVLCSSRRQSCMFGAESAFTAWGSRSLATPRSSMHALAHTWFWVGPQFGGAKSWRP